MVLTGFLLLIPGFDSDLNQLQRDIFEAIDKN